MQPPEADDDRDHAHGEPDSGTPLRVLLVEDHADDALLLGRHLIAGGYRPTMHRVIDAGSMRQALQTQPWDLVLSDYCVPGFDAPAALAVLRESGLDLPFIIISGQVSEDVAVAAMKAGAHDFISKDKLARLVPAITRESREAAARAQHLRLRDRLARDALRDPLTGLPNRALFLDRLELALRRVRRNPGRHFAVLALDLDRFQLVNDSLGHVAGDELLLATAERLRGCVRSTDTIARFSGDEFCLLLDPAASPRYGEQVARRIQEALAQPYRLAKRKLFTTSSIGLTTSFLGYEHPSDVMRDADTALHQAMTAGRAGLVVFDPSMHAQARASLEIENGLRSAIQGDGLRLYYQPIVSVPDDRITGFEALVRWQRDEVTLMPPSAFIEVAEDTGLIIPIGEWVLRTACRQLRTWQTQGLPAETVAVNISARQFLQHQLGETVQRALEESGLEPSCLELELTESTLMAESDEASRTLRHFRRLGVRLSLDDFGTGYSSLSLLRRRVFDILKIDRAFVQDLVSRRDDQAIVAAVLTLAHDLRLRVVAEGVETLEQLRFLRSHGCDAVQGFLFSPPVPAAAVPRLLRTGRAVAGHSASSLKIVHSEDPARTERKQATGGV